MAIWPMTVPLKICFVGSFTLWMIFRVGKLMWVLQLIHLVDGETTNPHATKRSHLLAQDSPGISLSMVGVQMI